MNAYACSQSSLDLLIVAECILIFLLSFIIYTKIVFASVKYAILMDKFTEIKQNPF